MIGRDRLFFSTEESGERQAAGLRQEVPRCHVDTCHGYPCEPLRPKQSETSLELLRQSQRRDHLALDQRLQGFDEVCDRLKCDRGITEHIGAPVSPWSVSRSKRTSGADSTTPLAVGCGRANGTFTGVRSKGKFLPHREVVVDVHFGVIDFGGLSVLRFLIVG